MKSRALVPVVMTLTLAACTSTRTVSTTTTTGANVVTGTADLSSLESKSWPQQTRRGLGVPRAVPGYLDRLSLRLSKPIGSRVLSGGVSASAVPLWSLR